MSAVISGTFCLSRLCHRYEDEINKRNNLENDFVILKKVSTHTHSFIHTGVVSNTKHSIVLFHCPYYRPSYVPTLVVGLFVGPPLQSRPLNIKMEEMRGPPKSQAKIY